MYYVGEKNKYYNDHMYSNFKSNMEIIHRLMSKVLDHVMLPVVPRGSPK